jgi:hypothetical protein
MLEGIDPDSKIGLMNGTELKIELNKILEELGFVGKGIRSAVQHKDRGILIEVESDLALNWLNQTQNSIAFRIEIGPDIVVKPRSHTVIAFNVPTTLDPENHDHRAEICEVNNLEQGTISTTRWTKQPRHRPPDQTTAHLYLTFVDVISANRAISEGLTVCSKRVRVEKARKEPTRCLKCQGWNHIARECPATHDICANCTGIHRTDQCPQPHNERCVSCKITGHSSWSRKCPTYLRKVSDHNSLKPENTLQFFPTTEPWTWTSREEPKPARPRLDDVYRPDQKNEYRPRRKDDTYRSRSQTDTYIPSQWRSGTDWNARPDWNTDPHIPSSWDEDTPHDNHQLFQRKTTPTITNTAPTTGTNAPPPSAT